MPLANLLFSQLTDPFRIGLIIALIMTTRRTQVVTGIFLPLAAGALFVAVITPITQTAGSIVLPIWQVVTMGFVANIVLIATAWATCRIAVRLRDGQPKG